jgi:hypothetical protein
VFELATLNDADDIAALTAASFMDNAGFNAIFQMENDLKLKERALGWLMIGFAHTLLRNRNRFLVGRYRGRIVASMGFMEPGKRHSFLDMIRAGVLKWPFLWGFASFRRYLEAGEKMSTSKNENGSWLSLSSARVRWRQRFGAGWS